MRQIVDQNARVVSVERNGERAVSALLHAAEIARRARPLQFVMVKPWPGDDPFLRRPFCLSLIDRDAGLIRLTWQVVGRGTSIMTEWEAGQEVPVLGPLGNGLDLREAGSRPPGRLFVLAGGTGLAPVLPLAAHATALGWRVSVFHGARNASFLLDTAELSSLGCEVALTTDDGSAGVRGLVTEVAATALRRASPADLAVACGPVPMMREAKKVCARAEVELYVVLEQRMACGTGLCRGCAVAMDGGEGRGEEYLHVCLEGPVFRAGIVDLTDGGGE